MTKFGLQVSVLAIAFAQAAPVAAQEPPVAPGSPPASTAPASIAPAPDAPGDEGLKDIIVTASRRSQDQQRAPVPLNVVGGDLLAARGTTQAQDLNKAVAGLAISPNGAQTQVFLRGVGAFTVSANSDSAVAVNLDQVFLAFPAEIGTIFYDLDRVEVLKGPQGTLYGRNATAGVINVITNKPRFDDSAEGSLEIGDYGLIKGNLALNYSSSEQFALRAAGQIIHRRGYLSDGLNDDKSQAGRLQSLIKPTENLSILLSGDYSHIGGKGQAFVPILANGQRVNHSNAWEGPSTDRSNAAIIGFNLAASGVPFAPLTLVTNDQFQHTKNWGLSAEINLDLGGPQLTVIPAYRDVRNAMIVQPGFEFNSRSNAHQSSLEARLSSGTLGGPLKWLIGGYYLDDKLVEDEIVNQGIIFVTAHVPGSTRSAAGFGELTYSLTDRLRLTGGLRYTDERRTQGGAFNTTVFAAPPPAPPILLNYGVGGKATFHNLSYKGGVDFDVAPRSLVYATVSTGFKAGGFNPDSAPNTYKPEKLTAYTIGSKNRFFDNKLQANLELFYWDYKDHQEIRQAALNAGSFAPIVVNTGKSTLKGVNLDLSYLLTRNDLFTAQAEYLDTKFKDFNFISPPTSPAVQGVTTTCAVTQGPGPFGVVDCSGKPFPRAAKWTATLGYQHIFPLGNGGKITAAVNSSLSSGYYIAVDYIPSQRQKSYSVTDFTLAYEAPGGRWSVRAYVRNIEDRAVYQGGYQQPFLPGVTYASIRPPRTYGGVISFKY